MKEHLIKSIQRAAGRPQTGTLDDGDLLEIHRKLTGVRYREPEKNEGAAPEATKATITNHGQ